MTDHKPKKIDKKTLQGKNTIAESENPALDFPVIAIGASAGGLEALQEFFKNMPEDSGAAFVVIQHLSPDYKSLMDELLARVTKMYIYRVEDGMAVQKNCIYLIPPGQNMTIFKGKLFLTKQQYGRSLNLPIDIFMRSLAKDQGKNAIGIVLSGTGSDGTLGIRAIKEYGGMVIAQDDQTAKFDGMPRSSINTGMVDYILPATKMPEELINYIKHPLIRRPQAIEKQLDEGDTNLAKIIMLIRDEKGIDFSGYKSNTIIRRLEKRISINRFNTIQEYADFLVNNPKEINILFKELLIGVTKFFRDEEAFERIYEKVLPQLFLDRENKKPLRVWSIACSTGEEAYSLAILIKEYMTEHNINREVKIFATDIDTDSIDFASSGKYPESIISDIAQHRLSKYFHKHDGGYQIKEHIRSMVVFAQHNILRDPPFSKIDLLSCRNMLIYVNHDIQQKILSMFYLSLNDGGFLFLGNSESIGDLSAGFNTIDTKWKIYRTITGYSPRLSERYSIPTFTSNKHELSNISSYYSQQRRRVPKIDNIFDEMMAEFLPPSVIVDDNYDIIHTIHNVSKYVSLPSGQISFNLLKMLPEELDVMVSSLLRRLGKSDKTISYEKLKIKNDNNKELSISGKQLKSKKSGETYFIVSFIENDESSEKPTERKHIETIDINNQYQERIEELEKELQNKSESLQATVEELETSNEELQSSNEELIASNEELQSTNEELQSVNEELYTVNAEHQKKIEELTQLNADMDNLLKNTQIGTLYLDQELTIRKFTKVAANITNILQTDIGRPIHHISFNHLYDNFTNDIDQVMETLQAKEVEIMARDNQWYLLRIIPFRTAENAIDGIIVTFVNISNLKRSEQKNQQISARLEMALQMGNLSWWEWDYTLNEVRAGENKALMLGYKPSEIAPGFEGWTNLLHPDDYQYAMQAMRDHLTGEKEAYSVEYRIKAKDGAYKWFKDKGGIVTRTSSGKPAIIAGIVLDITTEKHIEIQQKQQKELLQKTMEQNPNAVSIVDAKGNIIYANEQAKKLFEITDKEIQARSYDDSKWVITNLENKPIASDQLPFGIIKNKNITVTDYRHYIKIGKKGRKLLSISGTPILDAEKRFNGAVFSMFDITEKHFMELDLRQSEEKFRNLFDKSTSAMFIADQNRIIIDANESMLTLFGYKIDEIVGKKTQILYDSDDDFDSMKNNIQPLSTNSPKTTIVTYVKNDKTRFIGETQKFTIENGTSNNLNIVGIIHNISEKTDENKAMRLWFKTIDCSNEMFLLVDDKCNIINYNQAFLKTFNFTKKEVQNKKTTEILHGIENAHNYMVNGQCRKNKESSQVTFFETRIEKHIKIHIEPITNNNKELLYALEKIEIVDK